MSYDGAVSQKTRHRPAFTKTQCQNIGVFLVDPPFESRRMSFEFAAVYIEPRTSNVEKAWCVIAGKPGWCGWVTVKRDESRALTEGLVVRGIVGG